MYVCVKQNFQYQFLSAACICNYHFKVIPLNKFF